MARFIGTIYGSHTYKLRGPTRRDAEDELRMKLGALWKDDWKRRYSVKIERVEGRSRHGKAVSVSTKGAVRRAASGC